MRYVLVIAMFLFLTTGVFAGEVIEEVTLYWDWSCPIEDTPGLEWHLYMRGEGETYGTEPILISTDGTSYELTGNINITGNAGFIINKCFILRSFYNGGESGDSNEVCKDFIIPREAPLHLRFTVTVE